MIPETWRSPTNRQVVAGWKGETTNYCHYTCINHDFMHHTYHILSNPLFRLSTRSRFHDIHITSLRLCYRWRKWAFLNIPPSSSLSAQSPNLHPISPLSLYPIHPWGISFIINENLTFQPNDLILFTITLFYFILYEYNPTQPKPNRGVSLHHASIIFSPIWFFQDSGSWFYLFYFFFWRGRGSFCLSCLCLSCLLFFGLFAGSDCYTTSSSSRSSAGLPYVTLHKPFVWFFLLFLFFLSPSFGFSWEDFSLFFWSSLGSDICLLF